LYDKHGVRSAAILLFDEKIKNNNCHNTPKQYNHKFSNKKSRAIIDIARPCNS